jgi:hypothetical protein
MLFNTLSELGKAAGMHVQASGYEEENQTGLPKGQDGRETDEDDLM